jgi:hypothetical protein
MIRSLALAFATMLALAPHSAQAKDPFISPDIVILGDSQIPFGSGPAFLEFFENIKGEMNVAVIGVRSTALQHWTARKGRGKAAICKVDPKWKVNAGTYGFINRTGNKYAQIGRGAPYQFCKSGKSAFEAMFAPDYYQPRLLLMSFLGNATARWGNSRDKALEDVTATMAQIPSGTPCIFMTTAPPYSKKITDRRLKAQANIKWAFEQSGAACTFVEGATPETVAANQGNKKFFRVNKKGRVKDPFHPNEKAAKNFFAIEMDTICTAIYDEIGDALEAPS